MSNTAAVSLDGIGQDVFSLLCFHFPVCKMSEVCCLSKGVSETMVKSNELDLGI